MTTRILILGGGFGGLYTALQLEKKIPRKSDIEICRTLIISESNFWVMLHHSRMQLRRSLEVKYFRVSAFFSATCACATIAKKNHCCC